MTDVAVVTVPGPARRWSAKHEGTSPVHVLVLGPVDRHHEDDGEDRDVHIEHPPACPAFCYWLPPGHASALWLSPEENEGPYRGPVERGCTIAYELESNGLDGLHDPASGLDWCPRGGWPLLDGTTSRRYPGLRDTLPAGRYLVEAWWHDGHGTGEYGGQGDADSSFTLLGPETPPGLTYPPDLLLPHRMFTGHHRWPDWRFR